MGQHLQVHSGYQVHNQDSKPQLCEALKHQTQNCRCGHSSIKERMINLEHIAYGRLNHYTPITTEHNRGRNSGKDTCAWLQKYIRRSQKCPELKDMRAVAQVSIPLTRGT
jgi:hypothetical protein